MMTGTTLIKQARSRKGMTLVEMLVATTITLIMMGLVAQLFGIMGEGVTASRSVIETTDQMRAVSHKLRQDLQGLTAIPMPPNRPENDSGYLEIIEGPLKDKDNLNGLTADCDDILMFTTRSLGDPFLGKFGASSSIESPYAEVAWFCKEVSTQPIPGLKVYTLYRRQLLSMAYVGASPFQVNNTKDQVQGGTWSSFYADYDLSCHLEGASPIQLYPNSLGDLTKRENRFMHNSSYPYKATISSFAGSINDGEILTVDREGEDIVLTNVIAFDVRVFDPGAPIQISGGYAVTPGDPGYSPPTPTSVAFGAYVDLGWGTTTLTPIGSTFPPSNETAFQGLGIAVKNGATTNLLSSPTYDTWSLHYEFNGVDDDSDGQTDEGTNGLDDDLNNLVDEAAERETSPPYPVPLRGIEIRIRCYEPSSRQVRQVTVRHTFVPH